MSTVANARPMRILWIAHVFPPVGGTQGLRMARYLQELTHGSSLQVDVLTIRQSRNNPQWDAALAAGLPGSVSIHRVNPGWLYQHRFAWKLDHRAEARGRSWLLNAIRLGNLPWLPRAARWILGRGRRRYDGIYVFADPLVSIALGLLAARLNPDARLVLEYGRGLPAPHRGAAFLERHALARCRAAIVRTQATVRAYRDRYPAVPGDRFIVLYGGVDRGLYDATGGPFIQDRFSIVYTGVVYSDTVSPEPFFRAVQQIVSGGVALDVVMAGARSPAVEQIVARLDLAGVVSMPGHLALAEVAAVQQRASLLLAFGFRDPFKISSKLAQYFAARVPVLYIAGSGADPGAVLVSQSRRGLVVANDTAEIRAAIESVRLLRVDGGLAGRFDLSSTDEYSWESVARSVGSLLTGSGLEP